MTEHAYENPGAITYHQDGLLDLFMGFTLLTFGIGILTENVWLSGIMPAALLPIWISGRKSILKGRVHEEDLRSNHEGLRMTAMAGLFVLTALAGVGALAVTLLIPDWMHTWPAENSDLILGLGGALLLGIIGLILSARRLYAYTLLAVIIFVISYIFDGPLWLSTVTLSLSMILTGLIVLMRFLSKHPRIS